MSKRHRKPTVSTNKVAKITFTAAGSQRADHAGSGGRCAGSRAGFPLNALPVEAQNIVRAGVLAFVLGVGAVVANTPAVAFAAPDDTSSSGSSSTSSSSSESAASTSSTDPASSTASPASSAESSSGSTSEEVQSSVDSQTSSTSSPRHASTADPLSGVVQSSGGAHTGSTPSSSDTTASAEATPTPTGTSSADAAASPAAQAPTEQPTAASPAEQSTSGSPTEEPAAPAPSAKPVQSLVAQEEATPDAPQGDSHGAPNSAGSTLTNRSGSVSATSATQESTVVVRAAATSASTAEPPTATAAVESVAAISSAVEGAPETQAAGQPFSDPSAPPNVVSDVVSKVLATVGLNPFASDSPMAPVPVDSPAMWAMLAMARKQEDVEEPSSFGRMFGDLAPLNQQTNEELRVLAQGMLEVGAIANPKGTTAGITFFGQFIDHDLTLDTLPQPDASVDVNTLVNGRTFAFDLDSVYGGGPEKSPQLYNGDKFLLGTATDGVSPDLPRNPDGIDDNDDDGTAILVEHRNDENLIIAQIHLSFLRLHNALVDQGMSFGEAHDTVVNAYRYVVLHDYLPQIVGQDAVDAALKQPVGEGFYQPGKGTPFTPVEFSVAAFRFGHSQVRNAYNINDTSGGVPVFSLDPAVLDLHGGRQLPAIEDPDNGLKSLVIDFDNFFSELPREAGDDPALIGRAIDTKISQSLFQLPIPGAEGGGDNVLAFRNLLRAKFYDMPSGEAVAEAMGIPEEQIIRDPIFPEGTPLWFYILREAELTPNKDGLLGAELGPVGGRIVAEVFVDVLRENSGYATVEKPNLPDVSGGDFRIGDLLVAADQPVEEEPQQPAAEPCPTPGRAHEGSGRHRLHQQLHRAYDFVLERSGRQRLFEQLHGADN